MVCHRVVSRPGSASRHAFAYCDELELHLNADLSQCWSLPVRRVIVIEQCRKGSIGSAHKEVMAELPSRQGGHTDYFDPQHKTMAILGKGNRYRLINLWQKTIQLIKLYIIKYRTVPSPLYRHHLFINQRGEKLTRHGINRICKKYLSLALPKERVKMLNPVCSFRHSCAVDMLCSGHSPDEIKYRLGHQSINSTMVYLHLDINRPREIQKKMH